MIQHVVLVHKVINMKNIKKITFLVTLLLFCYAKAELTYNNAFRLFHVVDNAVLKKTKIKPAFIYRNYLLYSNFMLTIYKESDDLYINYDFKKNELCKRFSISEFSPDPIHGLGPALVIYQKNQRCYYVFINKDGFPDARYNLIFHSEWLMVIEDDNHNFNRIIYEKVGANGIDANEDKKQKYYYSYFNDSTSRTDATRPGFSKEARTTSFDANNDGYYDLYVITTLKESLPRSTLLKPDQDPMTLKYKKLSVYFYDPDKATFSKEPKEIDITDIDNATIDLLLQGR